MTTQSWTEHIGRKLASYQSNWQRSKSWAVSVQLNIPDRVSFRINYSSPVSRQLLQAGVLQSD